MTQISILGCGWLGLPLAKVLAANQFLVKGTTTSFNKIAVLEKNGIMPYLITLFQNEIQGDIVSFLSNSAVLFINIPPKLRGLDGESYVEKIKILVPFIEKSSVSKVLFISSTAVYAEDNSEVTEEKTPKPESESGKQLLEVEQLLQNNTNFETTILRFGGLIGDDRHPVYFLSGKQNCVNPNAPINLIHQKDCIGISAKIIKEHFWNEIFNGVAPFHPTRSAYYSQKATELNLPLPKFVEEIISSGKTISSHKIETVLGYKFQKESL